MMAKVRKQNLRKSNFVSPFNNYWSKENYIFLFVGILLLFVGYGLMGQGDWDSSLSLTYSPIVLIIAYLIVFPLSIFYRKKPKE
jgi:uncharacterized membrane protein YesL